MPTPAPSKAINKGPKFSSSPTEHPPPPGPLYGLLSSSSSRPGLFYPLRLLLDRLSDFCGLLWRFYGRDTLHEPGNDPTGFGVGLTLGGELLTQDGDQLRFISRLIALGRSGQYDVH